MKKRADLILLGAGSHARVVIDLLRAAGREPEILGAIDLYGNSSLRGKPLDGIKVLGDLNELPLLSARGARRAVPAIGDNRLRQKSCRAALRVRLLLETVRHPSAVVSGRACVAAGAVVCARAVVGTGTRVEEGTILNTACVVEHDCRIGPYAHVAPAARLAGNVSVGARAWVGLGASIREGTDIGRDAIIGAGSVVVRDVPAGATVAGIPARPLRRH